MMSVRTKILTVIGLTFIALLGALYFTAQWFLLQDTLAVEDKSATRDVIRLRASLDEQIAKMGATVGDWAPWDDTYEFINSGDPAYVDSNIFDTTFINLGVELMLFVNNSGEVVFGRMIDLESGEDIPIPQSLYGELKMGSRLLSHKDPADKIAGILSLPEGPMIVASQPIVTSQGEGPIRGTLIMGRFMNAAEIARLSARTQLSIRVFPYNGADLPGDVVRSQNSLAELTPVFVAPQNAAVISGYALVNDVYGKPALILRVDTPREAFAQAKTSVRYLGLALLAIGLFSALVTMLLLDKLVITRLTSLNSNVMKIGSQINASARVTADGNDEIFLVATSINSMLDSLESSRAKERESDERYKNLTAISPVGIFRADANGATVYVNPMWRRISGLSTTEALSSGWLNTIHPQDKERLTKSWQETTRLHKSSFEDYRFVCPDGTIAWVMGQVIPEMNSEDQVVGYLGTVTDITARKQIEAEQELLSRRLRDQQFYTRSLFESNIDALMTTDPSGMITDVNQQMEALTGCARDELIGAPFKNYFTDPQRAETSVKLVLSENKITNYELTARARDGKETMVSYNATTFYDRDSKLQGMFAAARDVTERNLLDQALQEKNIELVKARSVAEKANQAKSEFLSSMSHELRSPLNAILGFAQLLESESPPPTPDQKDSITQILLAGWHLLKLINEVLDLSKIESGKVPLSQEPVSLAEVMLECQGMIEQQAQERGLTLIFPGDDIPYFIHADRTRVKQVLINLLSNAIKYNSPQGTVEVKCAETVSGRMRISVRDTGAGLAPDQLAQLFQAFNRLGQEVSSVEGTGIGLVVTKRLVELMGGVVGVESVVGVGSEFWFELLLVDEPRLSMEDGDVDTLAQSRVPDRARLYSLLYIEDNPANLKLVEQIIMRYPNMRLLTAVNGKNGIELARSSQMDVILTDVNLPDVSGFEVLKTLQSDPVMAQIPIIALSANAMPHDIEKGMQAGFFRYITKPIKVNEFVEALDVALEFAKI